MKQVVESNKVVIKPTSKKGEGVFALETINKGEVVVYGKKIKQVGMRTTHSFQVDFNTHVQLNKIARSINHSCSPNTGVKNNIQGGYNFIALRDIQKGEEITWNYETTEYVSIAVRACLCGNKNCKRTVRGFKYRSQEIIEEYGGYIANYLKILLYEQKHRETTILLRNYLQKDIIEKNI